MKPMQVGWALGVFSALLFAGQAQAHVPLFVCSDNGDETITCEGGFSDGTPVAGLLVRVADSRGALLFEGKLDKDHTVRFPKPKAADFTVSFAAGEGHSVTIEGREIK